MKSENNPNNTNKFGIYSEKLNIEEEAMHFEADSWTDFLLRRRVSDRIDVIGKEPMCIWD